MTSRSKKTFLSLSALLLALVMIQPATAGSVEIPHRLRWVTTAHDPASVMRAMANNPSKLPAEFAERLKYVLNNDTLQVMVALNHRDADVEQFARSNTTWLHWYGVGPRFLGRVTVDQFANLLNSTAVEFVEPDYIVTNFMAESTVDVRARSAGDGSAVWSFDPAGGPKGALRSDIADITVDQATGKGVVAAVTDSGIDKTFKDFGGWDCTPAPFQPCESRIVKAVTTEHLVTGVPDPAPFLPTTEAASGHGSHVAGTIAGNGYYTRDGDREVRYGGDQYVFGMAPQASIISVKNGDSQSAGLSTDALQWQLDHAEEFGIKVSSNSWGCLGGCPGINPNSVIGQIFRGLYEAGVVTVFASGNDDGGPDGAALSGYSQNPYVVGVAAYNDADDRLADFSSRGSSAALLPDPATWTPQSEPSAGHRRPDIAAPGVSIWSAGTLTGGTAAGLPRIATNDVTGGENLCCTVPYRSMSGTSMATPHVAGAATLLRSICSESPPLDVMRALFVGANETKVLKTAGAGLAEPYEVGYGALDVRASVDWLRTQQSCGGSGGGGGTPTPDPTSPEPTPSEEPIPTPELPSDEAANILDPFGDANYVNDQGTEDDIGHVGEAKGPADASSVADFGKIWFTNTNRSVTVNVQTETKGPASIGLFYRVQVDPGTGSRCLWFQGATAGAGNLASNEATLRDTCDSAVPTSTGDIAFFDGPNGTGIMSLRFPLDAHPALQMGSVLGSPAAHSRNYAGVVTAPQIDNTVAGTEYEITPVVDPDPTSTATETASPTPVAAETSTKFTEDWARAGQYSDTVTIAARVMNEETDEPIADAPIEFKLDGAAGAETWTEPTGDDGIASSSVVLEGDPGAYTLTARYAGEEGRFKESGDAGIYTIDQDDSTSTLSVDGQGSRRHLDANLTDADSGVGLHERTVEFFADGVSLGAVTTDQGLATMELPPKYRNGHHEYEVVFSGDNYYLRSQDQEGT